MTLQEAEFVANEFNKFTSVLLAEVAPNVGGDYGVLVTRTDGRRAISSDLEALTMPMQFFRLRNTTRRRSTQR